MKRIGVLLVDDSPFMLSYIGQVLSADPRIKLVAALPDAAQALARIDESEIEVIVTDMVMPVMDGVDFVRSIMAKNPKPVLLLSSLNKESPMVFQALKEGAVDFIEKPNRVQAQNPGEGFPLVEKIISIRDSKPVRAISDVLTRSPHTNDGLLYFKAIVIGASTGGPGVIEFILMNLPVNFPLPIIIAQHMPNAFLHSFAARLSGLLDRKVTIATDNAELEPGQIFLMPSEVNTKIKNSKTGKVRFALTEETYPEYNGPSVNALFLSAAEAFGNKCIGLILSGMGRDGAKGMKEMHEAGAICIIQDEASAVVYGMPSACIEAGIPARVIKLDQIPGFLASCV
jgi:two-component system chemotaxis response regulator CheB